MAKRQFGQQSNSIANNGLANAARRRAGGLAAKIGTGPVGSGGSTKRSFGGPVAGKITGQGTGTSATVTTEGPAALALKAAGITKPGAAPTTPTLPPGQVKKK